MMETLLEVNHEIWGLHLVGAFIGPGISELEAADAIKMHRPA
jgi:hypothetical protein